MHRIKRIVWSLFLLSCGVLAVANLAGCGDEKGPVIGHADQAVLPAAPFWCGYEMGSSNDIPNYQYDCHWTSPSGLPDTVQKSNGVVVVPWSGAPPAYPAQTMPCQGNNWAGGVYHSDMVVANASCPHTFSPLCPFPQGQPPFDPWAGTYPAPPTAQNTIAPPTLGSSYFGCHFYPSSTTYGPTNYAQYVTSCTAGQTPVGSIDLYLSNNVGSKTDGNCARLTAPTVGDVYNIDYHGFLANGWLTLASGVRTKILSAEIGPKMNLYFSSNARVDGANWGCWWSTQPGLGTCKRLENSGNINYSLEADHFASSDATLISGWEPRSLMFYRSTN
jgi:hypothetical protein